MARKAKLTDLMARRKRVMTNIMDGWRELEKLDAEIQGRMGILAGAIEGGSIVPVAKEDEGTFSGVSAPKNPSPFLMSSAPFDFAKIGKTVLVPTKRKPTLEEPIVAVLRDAERPLTTKEILDVLQRRGVAVNGKRPLNTLSAHLSYLKKVVKSGSGWAISLDDSSAEKTNASQ